MIASPLPYLFAEGKRGDRQAREALFCTFNADLGYFERTVLGVTQSTGARVTVLGDGGVGAPDPRAALNAGTRYVHGLAVTPSGAAFHPKVTVVAGPERCLVAIGSGNLSPGGWHLNHETWTVVTGDREGCPAMVAEVAHWLGTLAAICAISPPASAGIRRTVALLGDLAATAPAVDTGHRIVHTSTAAIIDQLPGDPVQRLLLYAPFHDKKAAAIRRLIEQLRPASVTLAVQPGGQTVIQPDALRRAVSDLGVALDVVEDASTRYRHGKLIEAVLRDGGRWTLTGSPNLSARALLHAAADGGNIEVGVLSRPEGGLFHGAFADARPITLEEVPAVSIPASAAQDGNPALTLLSAVRTPDGLEVTFACPVPGGPALAGAPRILASADIDAAEWQAVGTVPLGAASHVMPGVDLPGGTRVRCEWATETATVWGGVIFVTDPALVQARPGEVTAHGRSESRDPFELILNPGLLDAWQQALVDLADTQASTALPRIAPSAVPAGEGAGSRARGGVRLDTDEENWLAYTDEVKGRIGTAMYHFVLGGLPGLRSVDTTVASTLREPADKIVDDSRAGLDTDDVGEVGDDTTPANLAEVPESSDAADSGTADDMTVARLRDMPERARRAARQRLASAVIQRMPVLPAFQRLAIVTLVMCAVEAGVWDEPTGKDGWIWLLAKAMEKLDLDDIPERISSRAASWAALATYLMHEHLPRTGRAAEVTWYEKSAAGVAHLFADADAEVVTDLSVMFTNKNGYPVDPDAVMHVIDVVVQGDPLGEAMDVLAATQPSWRVHKDGDRVLHVAGTFATTFPPAAQALEAVPDATWDQKPVVIYVTGASGRWTLLTRDEKSLFRAEMDPRGQVTWQEYRLSSLAGPARIARDSEGSAQFRVPRGPTARPFAEAIQALNVPGVDLSGNPPITCSRSD